jgi:hypothetical protein
MYSRVLVLGILSGLHLFGNAQPGQNAWAFTAHQNVDCFGPDFETPEGSTWYQMRGSHNECMNFGDAPIFGATCLFETQEETTQSAVPCGQPGQPQFVGGYSAIWTDEDRVCFAYSERDCNGAERRLPPSFGQQCTGLFPGKQSIRCSN